MTPKYTLLLAFALFATLAVAGESGMEGNMPGSKGEMGGGMSMMEMSGKAGGECRMMSDTLGGLLKTVQDAKRSDDKAKMKAALEQVEGHIAGMRSHMGECMNMMGMMEKMMGGGMMSGGMSGMDSAGNPSKAGQKPNTKSVKTEDDEHEKHHPKK